MKAFLYGQEDPDKYVWHDSYDVPEPENKKQVQVKVIAAAVNPIDYKLPHLPRGDKVKGQPIGYDFAGRVTRITDGCEYREGDVVYGKALKGCLAEYTLAEVDRIAKVPPQVDPKIAASLPVASLVAMQGLRLGGCGEKEGSGKSVLVIGASGGVGQSVVQIAKANGCKVYAVCGTSNINFVKSLGADVVTDHSKQGFALPNEDCPAGTVDMVFDAVTSGDDFNYEPTARKTLKTDGKYICVNSPSTMDWARYLISYYTHVNVQRKNYSLLWTDTNPKDLEKLCHLVMDGKLKIHIAEELPFTEENCRKAYELLKSRKVRGKIVIDMGGK
ncbi:alcohol dehydrogenase, putative [Perkinsus marinus ATCC 50983]|uniref:Alcohol dehydrogenase, putative n=1 Tax=Perkinsus marinus (strain ATCC 50983 / TXsc) TaxID=423536 RepID=C5LB08_PERM5|nr:alcohol dehydrogenase, putative [Perkinsus marinus ATCC 50983]EER06102.1 alcohol dehydrogenase, putative [Perkinsus marinus ATCC 50983]|eukprot:XP_002774286.1 alcohol dehydrogenase, putative [Perkinsus marinus ATCC 50983]